MRSGEGDYAVAQRCRSRALTLIKFEKHLLALREFRKAQDNWFHGDTLRGSLLAILGVETAGQIFQPAVARNCQHCATRP